MPHICCAPRCFNTSNQRYALMRFPKEDNYRKAWSDAALGENVFNRSLENLRLCEVHFESLDLLVVGSRKEVKKNAIPSRFCRCISDVLQDSHLNCDPEHSYSKSQPRKRKKEETHMRNVKAKVDTLENSNRNQYMEHSYNKSMQKYSENSLPLNQISPIFIEHSYSKMLKLKSKKRKHVYNDENSDKDHNSRSMQTYMQNVKTTVNFQIDTFKRFSNLLRNATCEIIDNSTIYITKLTKKRVCAMKHEINCPFTAAPLPIYEIKKIISTTRLSALSTNEIRSSKDNCLQHDINTDIMEFSTRKSDRSKSLKKSQNDKNKMQRK